MNLRKDHYHTDPRSYYCELADCELFNARMLPELKSVVHSWYSEFLLKTGELDG